MNDSAEAMLAAVREQYERYPFPPVYSLEQEDTARDLRESFNLDLGLSAAQALKPGARIWVPGCGTRWAVMIALQFSDAHVLASDLSDASLDFQSRLARSLNIQNLEFRSENLLTAGYEQQFDFISCAGVLHHLPEPAAGFAAVARALAPAGVLELMVYDCLNRAHSMRIQQVLRVLDPSGKLDAQRRFQLALQLLHSAGSGVSLPRETRRVLRRLDQVPRFAAELADFVSNPNEHYYDVPSLQAELNRVGLELRQWKQPESFDPAALLKPGALSAEVEGLDATQRAHLGQLLSTGLLEAFVTRPAPGGRHAAAHSLPDRRVRALGAATRFRCDESGAVSARESVERLVHSRPEPLIDGLERRPAVVGYGRSIDCVDEERRHALPIPAPLLEPAQRAACVGALLGAVSAASRPPRLGDVAREVGSQLRLPESAVLSLGDRLCRTPHRVLATVHPEA
jgi:SAM-dependent methyltransferase